MPLSASLLISCTKYWIVPWFLLTRFFPLMTRTCFWERFRHFLMYILLFFYFNGRPTLCSKIWDWKKYASLQIATFIVTLTGLPETIVSVSCVCFMNSIFHNAVQVCFQWCFVSYASFCQYIIITYVLPIHRMTQKLYGWFVFGNQY